MPAARAIAVAETSVTAVVGAFATGPVDKPIGVASNAEVERHFGELHGQSEAGYALHQYFVNGGRQAIVVRAAGDPASDRVSAASLEAAMRVLPADEVNLLCIPAMSNLDDAQFSALLGAANTWCEKHRVFLIVDPNRADAMPAWRSFDVSVASRNNAIYAPTVEIADPLIAGSKRVVAPSGTVAGIYARTDADRGVWKAPAGLEASLRGVATIVGRPLTEPESGELIKLGMNPLRELAAGRKVVWGARTGIGSRDPEWRYVPVRRLALCIERSLEQGLDWVVFEPNDEPLWHQVGTLVSTFMHDLFRRGALRGSKPSEAFFVRCDRTTMTQNDLDNGRFVLQVGFAPLKPAEFIVLTIASKTATVSSP